MTPRYEVRLTRSARRALTEVLPESVAAAVFAFLNGPLSDNPYRVGKQLAPPLYPLFSARRGEYRVLYRIVDELVLVEVIAIAHRRDAYRSS